ncbi:MAG: nucleoside hydrolase [Chitinophagaceae bacterium]
MNKSIQFVLVLAVLYLLLPVALCSQQRQPVSIIFDTDMGPDYDDIGAIAMLHALADSGECTILATIASNRSPYIAAVLNVMNTYFNWPGIPVGVVGNSNAVNISAVQKWDSVLASNYPHNMKTNRQAENATSLYRKLLAAAPDKSVTIVTVGFLTNMADLLQSGPDQFSPKDGRDLIEQKVKWLVTMAGMFGKEMGAFKEFNLMKDVPASLITFNRWPTPIVFSGFEIGAAIFTGLPLINNASINKSPVKDVFAMSIPLDPNDKNGRMSWDETAVLVAVRGYEKYFNAVKGKMICNADGSNNWDPAGTRDYYLVQKIPAAIMEQILNDLIMHQPVK